MRKTKVPDVVESTLDDESMLKLLRSAEKRSRQGRIFNQLLFNVHGSQRQSWDQTIRKYVRWRLKKSKAGFGIYDESDLYQRCIYSFYSAAFNKFELGRDVKFSTYIYSTIENTINRVQCELRKKKRTVGFGSSTVSQIKTNGTLVFSTEENESEPNIAELDVGSKIKVLKQGKTRSLVKASRNVKGWVDNSSIEDVQKDSRINPRYFTDSLHKPYGDSLKMSLSDVIPDTSGDPIPEEQALIIEAIHDKCKKRLTPMQYDIFFNGEVYKTASVHDLAKKYDRSEPTISAIKKRKILPILKEIKAEVLEEFRCVRL